MFNFSDIINDLEKGAVEAAKEAGINFLKEAAADAIEFVQSALPRLSRYVSLLLSKQITEDEFKDLILGLRDLAQLNGLTAAGLAAIEIEKTRNGILKAVTSVALGAINKLA